MKMHSCFRPLVTACGFTRSVACLCAKPQAATLLILLICSNSLAAQDETPPVAGRPEDFSGMAGVYKIAAHAEPRSVHVEEPITLVVRITGTGPPAHQPKRAELRLFPASMKDDFFIVPLPEKDRRLPKENAWEFVYRLQAKREGVTAIPGIKLVYYNPARGKFFSTYSPRVELQVTPRPQAAPPPQVVQAVTAPPSFYELAPMGHAGGWHPIMLAVLLLTPPLLAIGWRRWTHGNGTRGEQLRRSQAARHALRELAAENAPENVVAVVNDYLRQRLDVPMAEPAPAEIERILTRTGVGKPLRRRIVDFVRACDALRFSPGRTAFQGSPDATHEAMQLIQALEAEPCLR